MKTESRADDLRVRNYEPGDELEINAEFNRIFRARRTLGEWRAKYADPSHGFHVVVAVDGEGEIHAHYAILLEKWWVAGKECRFGQCVDYFARRSRAVIFGKWFIRCARSAVGQYLEGGGRLLYGFPGPKSARLGLLGGRHWHQVPMDVWYAPEREYPAGRTRAGLPSGRRADAVWEACRGKGQRACAVRDAGWIRRKYSRTGGGWFGLSVTRGWLGREVAAWGVFREEAHQCLWVDLLWDGQRVGDLNALAAAARLRLPAHKPLACWMSGDAALGSWMKEKGWTRAPHPGGLHFTHTTFNPDFSVAREDAVLSVFGADTDLFLERPQES